MALDQNIKTQLAAYMERLVQPIDLVANLDASTASQELRELLEEVAATSAKITLKEGNDINARKPSFGVAKQGEDPRVVFAGIPMGHEFSSLILALLQVSGYQPKIEQEKIDQIRNLQGSYKFETYISLSCHNCPEVVQSLNMMAALNPNIKHTMIDGALYQDEVNAKEIMSVPTIYLDGELFGAGRMGVDEILPKLDSSVIAAEADKLNAKEPFDILVVGGGPAGASAAIYAARKGLRTGIVAERFGGQVMDTMGIENFISVKATEGPQLVAALEEHVKDYEVEVMPLQRAASIVRHDLVEVTLENGATLKAKAVIAATGARWRELNVPGEKQYKGKGVAYCPHCDGPLFKGKPVAVVGGGNSGVEAAIDLAGFVDHVYLLQINEHLTADAVLQKKLNTLNNVTVLTNAKTQEVLGDGHKVTGLKYHDIAAQQDKEIKLDGVFIQIGLVPNTDWLRGVVELSKFGEVVVDNHGATNVPGIFAAGDVTTVPYKQIIIAMGEGAKASLGAFDYLIRQ